MPAPCLALHLHGRPTAQQTHDRGQDAVVGVRHAGDRQTGHRAFPHPLVAGEQRAAPREGRQHVGAVEPQTRGRPYGGDRVAQFHPLEPLERPLAACAQHAVHGVRFARRHAGQPVARHEQQAPVLVDEPDERLDRLGARAPLVGDDHGAVATNALAQRRLVDDVHAEAGILERQHRCLRRGRVVEARLARDLVAMPARLAEQDRRLVRGRGAPERRGAGLGELGAELRPFLRRLLDDGRAWSPERPHGAAGQRERALLKDPPRRDGLALDAQHVVHDVAGQPLLRRDLHRRQPREPQRRAVAQVAAQGVNEVGRGAWVLRAEAPRVVARVHAAVVTGVDHLGHLAAVVVEALLLELQPARPVGVARVGRRLVLAGQCLPGRLAVGAVAGRRACVVAVHPDAVGPIARHDLAEHRQEDGLECAGAVGARPHADVEPAGPSLALALGIALRPLGVVLRDSQAPRVDVDAETPVEPPGDLLPGGQRVPVTQVGVRADGRRVGRRAHGAEGGHLDHRDRDVPHHLGQLLDAVALADQPRVVVNVQDDEGVAIPVVAPGPRRSRASAHGDGPEKNRAKGNGTHTGPTGIAGSRGRHRSSRSAGGRACPQAG